MIHPYLQKRWLRTLLICTAILLGVYFLSPLIFNSLAQSLIRRDASHAADVVIALSGDSQCGRESYAADLYRQGLARKIVVGGLPFAAGIHSGDAAKQYLVRHGIPEADVIVLKDPWNTRIEADLLMQQMRRSGWQSAIVVTELFHSRRAMYTIEKVAQGIAVYSNPLPPDKSRWQPERWWTRRSDIGQTVREMLAWVNTLIIGLR
ncbi:MAG: YdcF family protein [Acidobacteria bacterium]|nr:YdcF family protein [Acidobacteriota bacterium]